MREIDAEGGARMQDEKKPPSIKDTGRRFLNENWKTILVREGPAR